MPGLDGKVRLVGRETTAELVERLVRYHPGQRVPILVLHGPGGVGKTAVLEHVERRYDKNVPMARVDFDEPRSKSTWDVLESVVEQLAGDYQEQFGRLTFPRFELVRTIRSTLPIPAAPDDEDDPVEAAPDGVPPRRNRRSVRDLLAKRLTSLHVMVTAVGDAAAVAPAPGFVVRLFQPLFHKMTAMAMTAPRWLRWLLTGPKNAAALRWFETTAATQFEDLGARARVDDAVLHIQSRFETVARAESSLIRWQRLAVSAVLADLRAAYRLRRNRKVNCVLLLDDADLLSPRKAERMALQAAPPDTSDEPDFLDLLSEAMREGRSSPLLVVATKQAGGPPEAAVEPAPLKADPVELAQTRYERWQEQFADSAGTRDPHLSVRLNHFDLARSRHLFDERSRREEASGLTERQVRELHFATHGHPLALQLAADRMDWGFRRDRQVPAARAAFDMRVPAGLRGADLEDTVGGYLLMRFLQRFRSNLDFPDEADEQIEIRQRTKEIFARLAAPVQLDEEIVELLTAERSPASVRRIKEGLDTLSFVERIPDAAGVGHVWKLDPLLRDLLIIELIQRGGGDGYSYEEVHRLLADHYERREHDSSARLHADYHLLALGEITGVAEHFAIRADFGDRSWQRDLVDVLAQAPIHTSGRASRPWDLFRTRNRTDSVVHNTEVFTELIRSLQALCSCSSRSPWSERMFRRVDEVQARLRGVSHMDIREWNQTFVDARYSPDSEFQFLPESSSAGKKFAYPRVWPKPGSIRRTTGVAMSLVLVTYGIGWGVHATQHCGRENPLDLVAVGRTIFNHPLKLDEESGQCIGVTDSMSTFSDRDGEPSAEQQEIAELSQLIHEENERVREQPGRAEKRPHITVVVATMLSTTGEGPGHGLSVGVNELRGAYLAQARWNKFDSAQHAPPFLVRIVLANFGGNSEHAHEVARNIRRYAENEPSVVAVTGLGQTRTNTKRAVELLGTSGGEGERLPMVGSAASGTGFTGKPYFFRIAPSNRDQAAVGADFAAKNFSGHKPYLLYDEGDDYGSDLAGEQEDALRTAGFEHPLRASYRTGDGHTANSIHDRAQEICEVARKPAEPDPLVMYSGRANELATFLDGFDSDCRPKVEILASDDLTQLATAEWQDFETFGTYAYEHLHFTSFGLHGDPDFTRFYERTARETAPETFDTGPNGHVLVAHDAVDLVLEAVQRTGWALNGEEITPEAVHEELRGVTRENAYQGVSGEVFFDSGATSRSAGTDPVGKKILVLELEPSDDGPVARVVPEYRRP